EGRTPGWYATGAVPRSSARARALTLGPTMRAGRAPLGSSPSAVKQREGGRRAEGRAGANEVRRTPQVLSAALSPDGRALALVAVRQTGIAEDRRSTLVLLSIPPPRSEVPR